MSDESGGSAHDQAAIDVVVALFFDAFRSGPDVRERLDGLRALFLPDAVIACGPTVLDVDGFIAPRAALLTGVSLTDFEEHETTGETRIFGDIAHRWSTYEKSGRRDGAAFAGRGSKSIQLVRHDGRWRISALAWDDER